jgi:arsenate reductase (thioredoxin)
MLAAILVLVAAGGAPREPGSAVGEATVVFVCEHGSAKSLMAQEWFNRLARERGLAWRAVSRGVEPDATVPPAIAGALREDGFDVGGFTPRAPQPAELAAAGRVVAIGLGPERLRAPAGAAVESWEGIPPASTGYAASRDALKARIEGLLKALEGGPPR